VTLPWSIEIISQGLGQRLKVARQNAGLRQEEVADVLGVHEKTVSRWEHGVMVPSMKYLIKLAVTYRVDIRDLLWGGTPPELVPEMNRLGLLGPGHPSNQFYNKAASQSVPRPKPQPPILSELRVRIERFLIELSEEGYDGRHVEAARTLLQRPEFEAADLLSQSRASGKNLLRQLDRAMAAIRRAMPAPPEGAKDEVGPAPERKRRPKRS
jgi:transcriptional regulator with XRE-family HTH domain